MSDLDADDESASQAAEKLADGLKSCQSMVKNYRLILAEQPVAQSAEPVAVEDQAAFDLEVRER